MSDTDSFIEEVTEEVRRDRLFLLLKRYGWIGAVAILGIVGGAAYNEYSKAQARAESEALGDALMSALEPGDSSARATALASIQVEAPGVEAIRGFLEAGALTETGDTAAAAALLQKIALQGELPQIYRSIATFKALLLQSETLDAADRRLQFEALASPGSPLRLLSEEQLALIDISEGNTQAAIDRLRAIVSDAEATPDLQQRATQVIVSLGGTPEAAS